MSAVIDYHEYVTDSDTVNHCKVCGAWKLSEQHCKPLELRQVEALERIATALEWMKENWNLK